MRNYHYVLTINKQTKILHRNPAHIIFPAPNFEVLKHKNIPPSMKNRRLFHKSFSEEKETRSYQGKDTLSLYLSLICITLRRCIGSAGISPYILGIGTRWRTTVNVRPGSLIFRKKSPWYTLDMGLSGPMEVWTQRHNGISCVCRESNPGCLARRLTIILTEPYIYIYIYTHTHKRIQCPILSFYMSVRSRAGASYEYHQKMAENACYSTAMHIH
jgi:hypothetical protein